MARTRTLPALLAAALVVTGAVVLTATPAAADTVSVTFTYSGGGQTFTVPAGVTQIVAEAWGAQGGIGEARAPGLVTASDVPGLGGYARSTLAVTPGEDLEVFVGGRGGNGDTDDSPSGQGGFNGGNDGSGGSLATVNTIGGGGGGASDVRQGGFLPPNRVMVAGGGGGAGGGAGTNIAGQPTVAAGGFGGDGGGLVGGSSGPVGGDTSLASGGRQDDGGAGGLSNGNDNSVDGEDGVAFEGGEGGTAFSQDGADERLAGGGGGGGGWFGGGGGGAEAVFGISVGAGGGGGSSFGDATEPGVRAGNGLVKLTYTTDQQPDAAIKFGGAFVGDNVYNTTGSEQSVTKSARRGQEVSYRVRVENDGDDPYAFKIAGPASDAQFSIRYKASGVDVTGAMTTENFVTPSIAPGTSYILVIKVKPNQAATVGSVKRVLLTVVDGSLRDAVRARTKVVAG